MSKLRVSAVAYNAKGLVRGNNEDNFYLQGQYMELSRMDEGGLFTLDCSSRVQVYAVSDGMGGEAAGEIAAFHVVSSLPGPAADRRPLRADALRAWTQTTSDEIYSAAKEKEERSGATLVMLVMEGDRGRLVNVGDSRIYALRGGALEQLTQDQTEVQRLVDLGHLDQEEARVHPMRHMINRYMGMPGEGMRLEPEISEIFPLAEDDRFLLCSDGLTDMVRDEEIVAVLRSAGSPKQAAQHLVEAAIGAGGRDNVTVMVLFVLETPGARQKSWGWLRRLLGIAAGIFGGCFAYLLLEFLLRAL